MFKKILIVILTCLVILVAADAVLTRGSSLVTAELRRITGLPVTVGRVIPVFPSAVIIEDVVIGRIFKAASAVVRFDRGAMMRGQIRPVRLELDSPVLNIDAGRSADAPPAGAVSGGGVPGLSGDPAAAPAAVTVPAVVLDKVLVHHGRLMLQIPSTGKTWIVENVDGVVERLPLNRVPARTAFRATASLVPMDIPFIGTAVTVDGWADWAGRNMDARLTVAHADGRRGLAMTLVSRANVLNVSGRVVLIRDQLEHASGKRARLAETTVLGALAATGTDIDAGFSFQTAMDRVDPGRIKIEGAITTELHSEELSSNIVGNLKAAGKKFLKIDEPDLTIKPYKK